MRFVSPLPWLAVVAVLFVPRGVPAAAAASPAAPLAKQTDRRADRFLAGWLERHPEEATRLGKHETDERLPSLSTATREADAAWFAGWRDTLGAVAIEHLSPAAAIDVRLALARATEEDRDARDRLAERDPGLALRRLEAAVETPVRSFYAPACSRAATLRRRLHAVPEYLRDARLALREPSRACAEAALLRVSDLLEICRVTLPDLLGPCHEPRIQADLAESDSAATGALAEYEAWLRDDVLHRAVDEMPLGRAGLEARLAAVAGSPVDLDSLLARARQEWSGLANVMPAAAEAARRVDADSVVTIIRATRATAASAREFALLESDRIDVGNVSPSPHGERLVALGPWDMRKTRVRVDVGPPPASSDEDDPMVSGAGAALVLAAEGLPGRALFELRSPAQPSRVRQAFGVRAIRDGWSRYVEWLWAERVASTPAEVALRRAHERDRLARAIAELSLRVEATSVDSVAAWLAVAAPLPRDAARRAALVAATEPRWAASTLAFWNLRGLRLDAERRTNPPFDAASFHDVVIREGAVPTAWIRAAALAAVPVRKRRS